MSRNDGYNPMRWDCQRQGCFNIKKRPKIEMFADCLFGRNAFSDIDGVAERHGNLLFIEWKDHDELGTGQRILFERITLLCPATVLVIEGDAEHMTVRSVRIVWRGQVEEPMPIDLEGVRELIKSWEKWTLTHSVLGRPWTMSCN